MKANHMCKAATPAPTARSKTIRSRGLVPTIRVVGFPLPIPVSLIGTQSLNMLLIGRH